MSIDFKVVRMTTHMFLVSTTAGAAALAFAAAAHAQSDPPPPYDPVPSSSDAICTTAMNPGACVDLLTLPESGELGGGNTGIFTNAAVGPLVELDDFDTFNSEHGSPTPAPSDYIYSIACNNSPTGACLAFDSDSETNYPPVPNGVIVAHFLETGKWQNLDPWLTLYAAPGTPQLSLWVTSDTPEPAAWAMMLVGFGLAGAALRRRTQCPSDRLA